MTRNICENCYWGDQCPEDGGCEHFDPLDVNHYLENTLLHNRRQYEYEWQAYMLAGRGEGKWGDLYDE